MSEKVWNPGLKGLQYVPLDETLLVCCTTYVCQYNNKGKVIRTFSPSNVQKSQSLVDIVITSDQLHFWVLDEATVTLFKFNIATGVEEAVYDTYLVNGSASQIAIFYDNPPEIVPVCTPETPRTPTL